MVFVEVDGPVRLHVQDLGEGPPVVLVAGFGLDHRVWDRQVRVLGAGHRVLCVDQRGHGLSDKPLTGYEVATLAEDLLSVLHALDVEDCAMVGWSFGGQVAFRATAEAEPGVVARLALVASNAVRASRSAAFPFGRPAEDVERALVEAETANRVAARYHAIASGFREPPPPVLLGWLAHISLAMPSWAAVECYRSMLRTDLMADLDRVRVPVLQIIGAADPVHSAKGSRWLNDRIERAELVELPDCGHYPMFEAPAAFDDALLRFVEGRPARSPGT